MDLELNEEQEMIRDAARDFAQNEIAKVAAHYDETGEFPYETINKMGRLGFMGIEVPEEYGGAGMDTLSYVLALEEINKVDAAHGTIMSVNNSLVCYGILSHCIGWMFIASSLPHVSTIEAGLSLLLQPTLSFVWDVLFFARPMTATELAGAAIALFAIYLGSRPASKQAQGAR